MAEEVTRVPSVCNADFIYRISDDSMIGVRIAAGDIVFVRRQDIVGNGDIALAYYNGEVRIGKYSRQGNCELLTPASCKYETIISVPDNPSFEIFGKAIAFMSALACTGDEIS